ncbi:MAG TPA: tyrosine-type recombinase/integrase [Candidatus Sulfotelmatobacter sp.]
MSRARGTGSLFRRAGCFTWTMQYYVDGRRIREKCETTDYAVAQRMLTRKLYQISQGELVDRERRPARVEELWLAMVNRYKADGRQRTVRDLGTPLINVPGQPVPEKHPPQGRWTHIGPEFGQMQARRITTAMVTAYQQKRREQGARPASINREVGALKHCLKLATQETPPRLTVVPHMPKLKENNTRTGFVELDSYMRLYAAAEFSGEAWLPAFLEVAFTYGWRHGELLGLRLRNVDLKRGTLRLEPGTTKNGQGRQVAMTQRVRNLLTACCCGKRPEQFVFTRANGQPVRDFRWTWRLLCVQCGLGTLTCCDCGVNSTELGKCKACKSRKRFKYSGLIIHDFRRSAAKAWREAGTPESVIMKMAGWETDSMFRRYAIVGERDREQAVQQLEAARAAQLEAAKADA